MLCWGVLRDGVRDGVGGGHDWWRPLRGIHFREEVNGWGGRLLEDDLGNRVALADGMASLPRVDDKDRRFVG